MRRERKIQVLSIVTLVLAIAGMSLGFAAFSATLNISSSATVTPNSDDFKITVYGINNYDAVLNFISDLTIYDADLSLSEGYGYYSSDTGIEKVSNISYIDQENLSISLNVDFDSTGMALYPFIIKNEGLYDAYLDCSNLSQAGVYGILNHTCSSEDASVELVNSACEGIDADFGMAETVEDGIDYVGCSNGYYKISPGIQAPFMYMVYYDGPLADGKFTVNFDDLKLNFTTTPPSN